MITARQAIDAWSRYRDGKRVTAWKPDEGTVPMGPEDFIDKNDHGPDYYGFCRVEEALTSLCKLRSQRETLVQLLRHCFAKGLPVRSFNGANFGWCHEALLQNTIDAIFGAIEARIREVPQVELPKSFEAV